MEEKNPKSSPRILSPVRRLFACDDAEQGYLKWAGPVLGGTLLLSLANKSVDPIFVGLLFLLAGAAVNRIIFPGGRYELRAFLLTYGLCVLVAGTAQAYSVIVFGENQSFIDAVDYFSNIKEHPPYFTWYELQYLWINDLPISRGAPLAMLIWQRVYHVCLVAGFDFGPYIGVLFNCLVVGLSGSLLVRAAREMFGGDGWRLRRAGTLFAWCGIFWLFAAIHIRDCFVLFANTLLLWGLIRFLRRPSIKNLLLASVIFGLAVWGMWFLRQKSVYLLVLFFILALLTWYWSRRFTATRLVITLSIPIMLAVIWPHLQSYVSTSLETLAERKEAYYEVTRLASGEESLGMALIQQQSLPIRLVLGSGVLLVFPIPLWAYLQEGAGEYHLLKTWQGIYMVMLTPLFLVGGLLAVRKTIVAKDGSPVEFFIVIYALVCLLGIAATTVEGRHLGQFLPGFILLAAIPETRRLSASRTVMEAMIIWLGVIVFIHILWAVF